MALSRLDLPAAEEANLLTIGAVAKAAGVTVRTIRYYEEMDLISPAKRTDSQYRLYSEGVLRRIKAILALQDLGYSLEQTLVVLGPYSKTFTMPKAEKVETTRDTLRQIAVCIDNKLSTLQEMRADIDHRLGLLDSACSTCVTQRPTTACEIHCDHRDIHMD